VWAEGQLLAFAQSQLTAVVELQIAEAAGVIALIS
jgi:hypothetical protein